MSFRLGVRMLADIGPAGAYSWDLGGLARVFRAPSCHACTVTQMYGGSPFASCSSLPFRTRYSSIGLPCSGNGNGNVLSGSVML